MQTLSPKLRFQENKDEAKFHQDLVSKKQFLNALSAALLEMEMGQPGMLNPATDFATASQMIGAKKFVSILLNLAEPESKSSKPPSHSLNHNA